MPRRIFHKDPILRVDRIPGEQDARYLAREHLLEDHRHAAVGTAASISGRIGRNKRCPHPFNRFLQLEKALNMEAAFKNSRKGPLPPVLLPRRGPHDQFPLFSPQPMVGLGQKEGYVLREFTS